MLDFAKRLRQSQTDAENLLWRPLRAHRLGGHKFKRRQPIGSYVVDFVCFERRLVIEVDGGQHLDSAANVERDEWLRSQNSQVVRLWNNDVLLNIDGVLEKILAYLAPSPQPLSPRGRGALLAEEVRADPAAPPAPLAGEGSRERGHASPSPRARGTETTGHSSLSPCGRGIEGEGA